MKIEIVGSNSIAILDTAVPVDVLILALVLNLDVTRPKVYIKLVYIFKIKNLETIEIEDALISHGWNVAAASRELGLGRTRLIARMKVLGIKDGSKGL